MAVTSQTPSIQFTANGSTTNFAFTFVVPASDTGGTITTATGSISAGDQTLTVTDADFFYTSDLVGKAITVAGAGSGSATLSTTILSRTSGTVVELTDAASTTVSGQNVVVTTGTFATTLLNNSDIEVFVDGVKKTIGASNDYTVRLNVGDDSNKSGEVIFNSAPANNSKITIQRDVTLARTTDFQTGGALTAKTLNSEFDTMIMAIQDTQFDTSAGAVKFPADETPTSSTLPSASTRANKVLAFDGSGELKVVDDLTEGTFAISGTTGTFSSTLKSTTRFEAENMFNLAGHRAIFIASGSTPTVSINSADINGGDINGTLIGNNNPAAGIFTDLTASGTISFGSGSVDINAGTIDGAVIGGSSPAAITTTDLTATTADINGGSIDGTTIGGSSAAPVTATNLTASGTISLNSLTYPTSDGSNDQVLSTDGSGNLSFRSIAGLSLFTALTDTPTSYSGAAGKYLKVNSSTNGVEFDTLTTDDVTEGSNLYFTNARADSRFDVKLAAADTGDLSEGSNLYYTDARADARVNNAIVDEDDFASNSATKVPTQQSTKAYIQSQIETKDNSDEITEGSTNLYFTNARARSSISLGTAGSQAYNNSTGVLTVPGTTDHITEGSNLYYTDARVQAVSINNLSEDSTPELGSDLDILSHGIKSSTTDVVISAEGTDKDIFLKIKDAGNTLNTGGHLFNNARIQNTTAGGSTNETLYDPVLDIAGGIRIGTTTDNFSNDGSAPDTDSNYPTTGLIISNGNREVWPQVDILSYGGANPLYNRTGSGGLAQFPNGALAFKAANGTASSPAAMTSGGRVGGLYFNVHDGNAFGGNAARASGSIEGNTIEDASSSNDRAIKMTFNVMPAGGDGSASSRDTVIDAREAYVSVGNITDDRYIKVDKENSLLDLQNLDLDLGQNGRIRTDDGVNLRLDPRGASDVRVEPTAPSGDYGFGKQYGWNGNNSGGEVHIKSALTVGENSDVGMLYNEGIQITSQSDNTGGGSYDYGWSVLAFDHSDGGGSLTDGDTDRNTSNQGYGNIWFQRRNKFKDETQAAIESNQILGGFFGGGSRSSSAMRATTASMFMRATEDWSNSNNGTKMEFAVTRDGNTGTTPVMDLKGNRVQINPDNNNVDFRVDGDTDDNIFMVDAGNQRVGVKTGTPQADLEVVGTFKCTSFDSSIGINTLGDVDTATNPPSDGQFLKYVAGTTNKWVPAAIGVSGSLAGALDIQNYSIGQNDSGLSLATSGDDYTYSFPTNQQGLDARDLVLKGGHHADTAGVGGSNTYAARSTGHINLIDSSTVELGLSNAENFVQYGQHSEGAGSNFRNSERNRSSVTFGLPFDQVLNGDRSGQTNHLRRAVPTMKFQNRGQIQSNAEVLGLGDGQGNTITETVRAATSLSIADFNYGGAITTEHADSSRSVRREAYSGITGVSKAGTGGLNIPNCNDLLVGAFPVGDEFATGSMDTAIVGDTVIMVGGKSSNTAVGSDSAGSSRDPIGYYNSRDQVQNRYLIEEAVRFESPSTGSLAKQTFTLNASKSYIKDTYFVQANTNATARTYAAISNSNTVEVYNVTGSWNTSDSVTVHEPGSAGVSADFTPTNLGSSSGGITNGGGRATFGVPITFANKTSTQRDALTAAAGMVLFNTTTSKLQVYNGSSWVDLH